MCSTFNVINNKYYYGISQVPMSMYRVFDLLPMLLNSPNRSTLAGQEEKWFLSQMLCLSGKLGS